MANYILHYSQFISLPSLSSSWLLEISMFPTGQTPCPRSSGSFSYGSSKKIFFFFLVEIFVSYSFLLLPFFSFSQVPGKIQHVLCTGNLCNREMFDFLKSISSDVHVVKGDFDEVSLNSNFRLQNLLSRPLSDRTPTTRTKRLLLWEVSRLDLPTDTRSFPGVIRRRLPCFRGNSMWTL